GSASPSHAITLSVSSCACASLADRSMSFSKVAATTLIYTLSLHDALPICWRSWASAARRPTRRSCRPSRTAGTCGRRAPRWCPRSEEHTSELQSLAYLVCRLLLEKKKSHLVITTEDIDTAHALL